ncbi:MAG TPA: hypothetical protein VGF77_07615 [Allosphingosinicella sp.]
MRRLTILAILGVAGCNSNWRTEAINNAEAIVRTEIHDPTIKFSRVEFMGDSQTGQTCGYFTTQVWDGGLITKRFIVFIDGGGGQNPFIDDPSARFPINKSDFALNWQDQCVKLGYNDTNSTIAGSTDGTSPPDK